MREDVGRMMVPVQLDGSNSEVSLRVSAVDGTAYGNATTSVNISMRQDYVDFRLAHLHSTL